MLGACGQEDLAVEPQADWHLVGSAEMMWMYDCVRVAEGEGCPHLEWFNRFCLFLFYSSTLIYQNKILKKAVATLEIIYRFGQIMWIYGFL